MSIKNVVFDLGGVVVDWDPGRVIRTYPGNWTLPDALFEGGFFEKYWPEYDRGTIDQAGIVNEMSRFTGYGYDECWELVEFIKHSLCDLPETQNLIKELAGRGYRLFCLSNMSVEFYDYLKCRKVFSYFEGRIISALEHVIKPEKEIYEILTDRYGLVPAETVFVDDLERNIEAARALGFHTVHFRDVDKSFGEEREGIRKLREMLLE